MTVVTNGKTTDEVARTVGLGIDCPRIVKTGLAEHEKRLLAVTLNLARRQLTDAQKVALGEMIREDVAAEAKARQSHGMTAPGKNALPQVRQSVHTPDVVAARVGLGSGDTFERGSKALDQLRAEPDADALMKHVGDGSSSTPHPPPCPPPPRGWMGRFDPLRRSWDILCTSWGILPLIAHPRGQGLALLEVIVDEDVEPSTLFRRPIALRG